MTGSVVIWVCLCGWRIEQSEPAPSCPTCRTPMSAYSRRDQIRRVPTDGEG